MQFITWFPTGSCNLNCRYCFTALHSWDRSDSTEEIGKATIDLLLSSSKSSNVSLAFFGGEPLLRADLIDKIAEYGEIQAKKARKNIGFSITTNGLLVPENLEMLRKHSVGILLSADGKYGKSDRVDVEGNSSVEKVFDVISFIVDNNYPLSIRWTLVPEAIPFLVQNFKEFLRIGVTNIALEYVYEVDWTKEDFKNLEEALHEAGKIYIDHFRRNHKLVFKPIDGCLSWYTNEKRPTTRCGTATNSVSVDAKGNIYPCHRFVTRGGPILGNVTSGWDEDMLKMAQEWDVNKCRPIEGSCKDCPVQIRCPGSGCLCVNLDTTGDRYVAPNSYCSIQKIEQRVTHYVVGILMGNENKLFMNKLTNPDFHS